MQDFGDLRADIEAACQEAATMAIQTRETASTEIKPDGSIVTSADRRAETMIREAIAATGSNAAVWGEEFGYQPPNEHGLWLIDPIDGTSNYAFGQPLWGVTVALYAHGNIQLGCICVPQLGWTLSAVRGGGATLNGRPMPSLKVGPVLPHELVGHGDIKTAIKAGYPGKARHIGSFVVEAGLFLTGGLRVLLTNGVRLYDAAAGIVLAREVGAEVFELSGRPFDESEWLKDVKCRTFGFFPPGTDWPFQSQ